MALSAPTNPDEFQEKLNELDTRTRRRHAELDRQLESSEDAVSELAERASDSKMLKLPSGKYRIQRKASH